MRDDPVDRARQAAGLCPLLQHHLGIPRRDCTVCEQGRPVARHERPRRLEAAIEIDRADQRLAAVGEQGRPHAPPASNSLRADLQPAPEAEALCDLGQALLAHERHSRWVSMPFGSAGKRLDQQHGPRPGPSTRSPRNSSRSLLRRPPGARRAPGRPTGVGQRLLEQRRRPEACSRAPPRARPGAAAAAAGSCAAGVNG